MFDSPTCVVRMCGDATVFIPSTVECQIHMSFVGDRTDLHSAFPKLIRRVRNAYIPIQTQLGNTVFQLFHNFRQSHAEYKHIHFRLPRFPKGSINA